MSCPRSWQIEAARDGRLTGKDLGSAVRHRERCADCAREHLELTRLAGTVERLPLLTRDSMTTHRERQQLMAAMNDAILAPPKANTDWRGPLGFAVALVVACGLFGGLPKTSNLAGVANVPRSVVEVHAQPGSNWTEHVDDSTDRVDLTDGIASFRVHPHRGQRVVIRLPDGEIEDMGTVFEVDVHEHQTRSIAVREGRVLVRLHAHPEFTLSAGQAWRRPESVSVPPSNDRNGSSARAIVPRHRPSARANRAAAAAVAATLPPKPADSRPADVSEPGVSKTEDLAYLSVVALLNQHRYAAAQAAAKEYLLQFPSGFRRVEVLNVAMRSANDVRVGGN